VSESKSNEQEQEEKKPEENRWKLTFKELNDDYLWEFEWL